MSTTKHGQKRFIVILCYLKKNYSNEEEILSLFENYEISKLDINRIYRFIDKYSNYNLVDNEDNEDLDGE